MHYKPPPNQETFHFTIAPRGYGKTVAVNKQTKGKKLPMAALPNPKTQDTINPANLFIGDRFRIPGSRTWYTTLEEPTSNPMSLQVTIRAKSPKGTIRTITIDSRTNVYTNGTPTR